MHVDDPDAQVVLERERALLRPEVRSDSAALGDLLHPEFFEIGVTRCTDRADVLERLPFNPGPDRAILDPQVVRLAPEVVLLTYRIGSDPVPSIRSSIWIRSEVGWQLRFHQGTPIVAHVDASDA